MTAKEIKRTLQSEFVRTLRKPFVDAVKAYGLVKPSDKVAVCISGGKDSMLLALLLQDLQHTVDFDLVFLAMDPGYAPRAASTSRKTRNGWTFRSKFSIPMCCACRGAFR